LLLAVGMIFFASANHALYWKNNIATILDSTSPVNNVTSGVPVANSIFVSGTDVYIAGQDHIGVCYWKNGVPTYLSTTLCNSIFVYGSDLYVTDGQFIFGFTATGYLKNGMQVQLPTVPVDSNGYIQSLHISGTDVYACGGEYINQNGVVMYWENGAPSFLSSSSDNSYPASIIVNGSDIYNRRKKFKSNLLEKRNSHSPVGNNFVCTCNCNEVNGTLVDSYLF
jgi:hypothetical protein